MGRKTQISQDVIVDTALDIVNESGLDMVTLANIARRLNIKPPSLYNHFSSLHDIRQAIAFKAQAFLVSYLLAYLKENEGSSSSALRHYAHGYFNFAKLNKGYYEASIIALDSSIGLKTLPSSQLTTMLKEALQPYNLDEISLIHAIRGLRSILHGLIDLYNKGGFKLDVNIESTLDYMIDLYIAGISHK